MEDVEFVVETELLALFDIFYGHDSDFDLASDVPLARLAVRVTRVVYEPCHISFVGGVDDFLRAQPHHVGACGLRIVLKAFAAFFGVDAQHLANVLDDESLLRYKLGGHESESFFSKLHGVNAGVLVSLELAVLAMLSARAHAVVALYRDDRVKALAAAV